MPVPAHWHPHIIDHVAELTKGVNGKTFRASTHKADEKAASVERRSHDKRDGLI